ILGSPHFSLAEFSQLAPLVRGHRKNPRLRFLVTSSRLMKERAAEAGVLEAALAFGAEVTLDTCILASPMLPPEIKTLMTNSAKYAYYAPSLLNTRVTFGSLAVVAASAEGEALVTGESLSFWGGYDFRTGEIIDRHHPLAGVRAAGRILAVPFSKGSSTTTAVLLEAVRAGTAPAAIVTTGTDAFFALASIVADVMYGKPFPVIALNAADFAQLKTGDLLAIEPSGAIRRLSRQP